MAVRGRAYWKGHLRLSLVSIPVEIHNAVDTSEEIHFNQIHKPTGKRINYTKTVEGEPINASDIVKGYEIEKDQYVILEPEEIDAIKLESKSTLDLIQFVDQAEIDPRYFERPYYLVPKDKEAAEGYMVIRDALQKAKRLGVGQVTMSGREYLVGVGPIDKGLGMEIMRYGNELKSPNLYFNELPTSKVDPEMVSLAAEIIKRKSSKFDPISFKDHYAVALSELVALKSAGKRIVTTSGAEPSRGTNVVNLMEALRKSVQSDSQPATTKAKPKKRVVAQ
jgi:DNA end-binding protein Ku